MTLDELYTYCKIKDMYATENGRLILDESGRPIFWNKFIEDNNFLVSPTLDSKLIFTPGTNFTSVVGRFRIPYIEITNNGVIIAGTDVRYNTASDYTETDTGIRRSTDGGATWGPDVTLFANNGIDPKSRKHNGTILVDRTINRVFVFAFVIDNYTDEAITGLVLDPPLLWDLVYKYSDDDGATWSDEISLKALLTDATANCFLGGSSNKGITMQDGTIVLPIYDGRQSDNTTASGDDWQMRSGIIYSTDHGATWTKSNLVAAPLNECSCVEIEAGKLLLIARGIGDYQHIKGIFETEDMGETWTAHVGNAVLKGFECQIGTQYMANKKLVSFPIDLTERKDLRIQMTKYFRKFKQFLRIDSEAVYGYSSMAYYNNKLYMIYEKWDGTRFIDLSDYVKYLT